MLILECLHSIKSFIRRRYCDVLMFRIATQYVTASRLSGFPNARTFHATSRLLNSEKLRILFCGADRFSIAHLQALHEQSNLPDSQISNIDVVTRTDKRSGRGGKSVTSPPLKYEADQLGLTVHQLDTFTGWQPPPTDLIVAVSFGILVPARIINASTYGGINVHPSLLPDLRGAAPVHWAILLGRKHTGVTVQTLHPTKFDEGVILDQTPAPGIPINGKYGGLTDTLAAFGADMLVNTIRKGLYRPPYRALPTREFDEIALAPKIASEHMRIDFNDLTSADILRRVDAFNFVFALAQTDSGKRVRVKLQGEMMIFVSKDPELSNICRWQPVGQPFAIQDQDGRHVGPKPIEGGGVFVNTIDGKTLWVTTLVIENMPAGPSASVARQARLMGPYRQQHGFHGFRVAWFYSPLTTPEPTEP